MTTVGRISEPLGLKAGEWVYVRTPAEILRTLDAQGRLDGLPFMPEMLQYCGRRVQVFRRADKTCDTIGKTGSRRMQDAVHLDGLRCDGASHGGCQAACLIFWKEAWLSREPVAAPNGSLETAIRRLLPLAASTDPAAPADVIYSCQATELTAATTPLPWWDARQYVRELRSGNWSLGTFVRTLAIAWYNAVQRRLDGREYRRVLPHEDWPLPWWDVRQYYWRLREGKLPLGLFWRRLRAARAGANPGAPANPAAAAPLNLQPGERVRVRPVAEIVATLSRAQRHRGLWFDVEMTPFCGGEYRVLQRVQRLVNERTGRMIHIRNDCLILEGVACGGCLSRNRLFCSRSIYPYWREAWLERVG